jgi:hypothetical protein
MLLAWLPKMLSWSYGNALEEMLKIAARYCALKIAEECERQAGYLRKNDEPELWLRPIQRTAGWAQRRQILLEAVDKLREIKL